MAKTKISEFSATPGNNTDIDSINIAEGCAPSGINDAIRELMAQLKDFQTGAVGDSFNGPVGTTTAAAGAFTTLAASSTVTLSGGTANGVPYLNGSKVLTSGSALVFDGTNLGVGISPRAKLDVNGGIILANSQNLSWGGVYGAGIPLIAGSSTVGLDFYANGSTGGLQMRLDASGNLGLGVTPSAWNAVSYRVLELPTGVSLSGEIGAASMELATNAFLNSSYIWTYKTTAAATHYRQNIGQHQWFTAPSGTAGNAISFTQAMTLTSGGTLQVGNASANIIQMYHNQTVGYIETAGTAATAIGFATNGLERARIDSSGNFSISNNAGATVAAFIRNKGVGATGSGAFSLPYTTVNFTPSAASSNIYWDGNTGWLTLSTSSQKYKRNITAITDQQLDKALQLKPSYYQRLEYDYWEYGFIAEEVNDIGLDEFVTKVDGEISGLNYEKMITLAIGLIQRQDKAIQEQQALILTLQADVAALKAAA